MLWCGNLLWNNPIEEDKSGYLDVVAKGPPWQFSLPWLAWLLSVPFFFTFLRNSTLSVEAAGGKKSQVHREESGIL